jgi:L-alanine-DL-glutamate epimerase-like enolase superfamily enzyme
VRIVGAEVLEYFRELDGKSWNPVSRWTDRRAPLLLLHADNGLVGIGEAWSKQDEIGLVLDELARLIEHGVIGRTFDDADAIRELAAGRSEASWVTSAAASGVDIALWDLLAKSHGEPLWKTLGGTCASVRIYASGGLYRDGSTTDDLVAEGLRYRDDGFRDIKIKVGGMPLGVDVERIEAVRRAMGNTGELWVDAVNQLPRNAAFDAAMAYKRAGASALQAPVAFDDYASMSRINRECLPVIAAESAHSVREYERLLDAGAVGLLQFNVALCGGLSGGVALAALARRHSIAVTPQCHATTVLQSASLHCGAAVNARSVEFHRFHEHLAHLAECKSRTPDDGWIALGDAPGLGVAVPVPGQQRDSGTIRCSRAFEYHRVNKRSGVSR